MAILFEGNETFLIKCTSYTVFKTDGQHLMRATVMVNNLQ